MPRGRLRMLVLSLLQRWRAGPLRREPLDGTHILRVLLGRGAVNSPLISFFCNPVKYFEEYGLGQWWGFSLGTFWNIFLLLNFI